jgi:hypothetical protein
LHFKCVYIAYIADDFANLLHYRQQLTMPHIGKTAFVFKVTVTCLPLVKKSFFEVWKEIKETCFVSYISKFVVCFYILNSWLFLSPLINLIRIAVLQNINLLINLLYWIYQGACGSVDG